MTSPGPIGEEAARLFEALGEWARTNVRPGAATDMGGQLWQGLAGGIADGSPACQLCPVCQLIAVLRSAKPETFNHLLEASTALTAALRSMMDTEGNHAHRGSHGGSVQRINLDPPANGSGQGRTAAPA